MNLIREVAEKVARPFSEKFMESQGLVAKNLMQFKGKIAVAFSGGKDSLVVLHLAHQLNPDISVVFNNTGVEYPETVSYIKEMADLWNLNLVVTHPEKTFWQCVEQYGFLSSKGETGKRHKGNCCFWLKERPMKEAIKQLGLEALMTGMTAVENRNRMFIAKRYGSCYYSKTWGLQRIHPILW